MTRRALLLSAAGHGGILFLAIILSASRGPQMPTGGDAVWVDMVTIEEGPALPSANTQESLNPEVQPENVQPEVQESPEGLIPVDSTLQSSQEQDPQVQNPPGNDDPPRSESFSSVTSSGEAGTGAPGPATYEGRVFSAIRRNFRTSVQPQQSFRIELTVSPDGTVSVDTLRQSGVDAFDRAVEHALAVASIPPFPQGRTSPAVLRIEFLGTDQ
jgi:hypothetical protein